MRRMTPSLLTLLVASGLSLLVHAGIGATASPRGLVVEPAVPSCRIGEHLQLAASAKSLWGRIRVPASDLTVQTHGGSVAVLARQGQLRCEHAGRQPVRVSWGGLHTDLHVHVRPAVVPIEPPQAKPGSSAVSAQARNVKGEPGEASAPARPAPEPSSMQARRERRPLPRAAAAPGPKSAPELSVEAAPAEESPPTAPETETSFAAQARAAAAATSAGNAAGQSGGAPGGGAASGAAGGGRAAGRGTGAGGTAITQVTSPALRGADPCAGYFPDEADVNAGMVTVDLVVEADGRVSDARVIGERPAGQGFAEAARACMLRTRLEPGRQNGRLPVRTSVRMKIDFIR